MGRLTSVVLPSVLLAGTILSASLAAGTSPPVVHNLWIANDRVADCRDISTMAATFGNAYSPSGVVAPTSDQQRAINVYNNFRRRCFHWIDEPPAINGNDISDPVYNLNIFGWAMGGRQAGMNCTILQAMGLGQRKIQIPGEYMYEVSYDGGWHLFDALASLYVYDRSTPRRIASCEQIKTDATLLTAALTDGRSDPGFLMCGDDATWFANAIGSYSSLGSGAVTVKHSMNMDLRCGESFSRTSQSWDNQHPTPSAYTNCPPFHQEDNRDWKDTTNFPYWDPYPLTLRTYAYSNLMTSYRRWFNGTDELAPNFYDNSYRALLHGTSVNIATHADDGLTPELHAAAAGTPAEAVFHIQLPFYITDSSLNGYVYRHDSGDSVRISFSANGTSWTPAYITSADGTTPLNNFSLRTFVFGRSEYYLKVQINANGSKTDAGVSQLRISTTFEHNKEAMAYLDKGVNHITVTFDNPQDLVGSGKVVKITYRWKEYDGAGWTIDKRIEAYLVTSPTTFTINTYGSKVPRTESILAEVVDGPECDSVLPITDLCLYWVNGQRAILGWTAPGGCSGSVAAYDLRYSTMPITEENWAAASPATNLSAPQPAGSMESYVFSLPQSSTQYYFAIRSIGFDGMVSPLSNVATWVCTSPMPPILDLAGVAGDATSVDLTWTAVGSECSGPADSYDLRYSTSPITSGSFQEATVASGTPAPQEDGGPRAVHGTWPAAADDVLLCHQGGDGGGQ